MKHKKNEYFLKGSVKMIMYVFLIVLDISSEELT